MKRCDSEYQVFVIPYRAQGVCKAAPNRPEGLQAAFNCLEALVIGGSPVTESGLNDPLALGRVGAVHGERHLVMTDFF